MNLLTILLIIILLFISYKFINLPNITPINKESFNSKNSVQPNDTNKQFSSIDPIILDELPFDPVQNINTNYEIDDVICNNNTRSDIGLRDLNTLSCPIVSEPNTKTIEIQDEFNNREGPELTIAEVYDKMVQPEFIGIKKELVETKEPDCNDDNLCVDQWSIYQTSVPAYGGNSTLDINNWGTYKNENQINGGISNNLMAYDPSGDLHTII